MICSQFPTAVNKTMDFCADGVAAKNAEQILNTDNIKAKETKHFTMSTTAVSSWPSTRNPTFWIY